MAHGQNQNRICNKKRGVLPTLSSLLPEIHQGFYEFMCGPHKFKPITERVLKRKCQRECWYLVALLTVLKIIKYRTSFIKPKIHLMRKRVLTQCYVIL